MTDGISNFIEQVQSQLNELGDLVALSAGEQDVVMDFHEQEFSARCCADRIVASRAVK